MMFFCLLLIAFLSVARAVDYASPSVFNAIFYINTHADLKGYKSADDAKHHWLTKGIAEGRQGAGNFHSKQYLKRYSDLGKTFGNNYKLAIQHYLENGIKEHRLGYLEGGDGNRYTISNRKDLFISSSRRTAGAIDSLVWNNKEFINAWDHGRELQLAVNPQGYGECFNPTEAGGSTDGLGEATKSRLQSISVHGTQMNTSVFPAFWKRHNTPCHHQSHPINTMDTYEHPFDKEVTIGCAGLDNCIKFSSHFVIAGHWPDAPEYINFEAPTGYLTGEFNVIKNYNPSNGQIQPHTSNSLPPVFVSGQGGAAMGVFAPDGQDTDYKVYYATWNFHGAVANRSNKWNVVFRKKPFKQNSSHKLSYVAYICVGTPDMVSECLRKVIHTYPKV